MSLDHAILGFLDHERASGYDLKTRGFDRLLRPLWTADQAQVYRTLDRLLAQGYVDVELVPQRGKPDRKLFAITPSGHEALAEWLATPHPLPPLRDPFLVQLFFSEDLSDDALLAVLRTSRDGYQSRLDATRDQASALGPREAAGDRRTEMERMALDGALARTRATIDWLDDWIERTEAGLPQGMPANGRSAHK